MLLYAMTSDFCLYNWETIINLFNQKCKLLQSDMNPSFCYKCNIKIFNESFKDLLRFLCIIMTSWGEMINRGDRIKNFYAFF